MRAMQPIIRLDVAVSLYCLQHRFYFHLARLSKFVSATGDGPCYILLLLLVWQLDSANAGHLIQTACYGFALERPLYWLAKNSFRRRRPHEFTALISNYITPCDRYSLPSGHTAAALLVATLISCFYPALSLLAYSWAVLIGFSRVLLGVHFITDVLLGAVLGMGCAYLAIGLTGAAI